MPLFFRKLPILAKIETTAGTDAAPTGAANAMLVRNVTLSPLEMELEERNVSRPYMGNSDSVIASTWQRMEFEVELAGAGAAGTVPKYGPLLRACGMSETISAGVEVAYSPVSTAPERLTIYANLDGVLHKMTYGAGNVAWDFTARKTPFMKFSFIGFFLPVTDVVLPTAVYTGFQVPLAFNKANATTARLLSGDAVIQQLKVDLANKLVYRNLANHESTQIVDRNPRGRVVGEATTVATRDVFGSISAGTSGQTKVVHGTVTGNMVELVCAQAQLVNPKYSESDGIAMLDSELIIKPTSGNDEIIFKAR